MELGSLISYPIITQQEKKVRISISELVTNSNQVYSDDEFLPGAVIDWPWNLLSEDISRNNTLSSDSNVAMTSLLNVNSNHVDNSGIFANVNNPHVPIVSNNSCGKPSSNASTSGNCESSICESLQEELKNVKEALKNVKEELENTKRSREEFEKSNKELEEP